MIIECPNCETRYEAPVALPPEGRKVRCARCQHIWTATAEPETELAAFEDEEIIFKESAIGTAEAEAEQEAEPEAEAGTAAEADPDLPIDEALSIDAVEEPKDAAAEDAPAADEEAHPEEEAETIHADDAEEAQGDADGEQAAPAEEDAPAGEEAPEDAPAEDAAFPEDDEAADEEEEEEAEPAPIVIGKAQRRVAAPGPLAAGWGLLVLLVVGLAGFVSFQRVAVVRALPGTAWIYERAGLPVNVRGLTFENVAYTWETEAGRAILEVRGDIVNVSGESRKVPTVVLGLRTAEDVEVYQWAQEVGSGPLAPDARAAFLARIPTPPNSIRGVQVRFAKVR